jgi:beta-lactamase class A
MTVKDIRRPMPLPRPLPRRAAGSIRALVLFAALLLASCASVLPASHERAAGPPGLEAYLRALARGFDGRVGIAVEDVQTGWVAAYDGAGVYPQQSVSKLWVGLAVFDAVDRGKLSLSDPVLVRREDMSVFNQPIQKVLGEAGYPTTIDGLLGWSLSKSDNAADDILMSRVGGPGVVQHVVASRHLKGVKSGPPEHLLEAKVAGLSWKPEYSFGQAFWTARGAVPMRVRAAKLEAYLSNPDDGATPIAIVDGLSRLKRGELLSPASTARFLDLLAASETGPLRLKAGLAPGWSIAHKTGTGQDLGELSTGYNDVGLLTAPDGRAYAVAVMIASTRRPIPDRQTLMASVARAVVAAHDHTLVR